MGGCQGKNSHLIVPLGPYRQRKRMPSDRDYIGKFVHRLLQVSPHELTLPDMYLGDKHMRSIARLISYHEKLQYLDLSNHSILDRGVINLCKVLPKHPSLTYLDLSCNHIGKDGAIALSRVLGKNCKIKTLKLHDNSIGKGLHEIARVIGEKNFVRELWLSGVDATTFSALARSTNDALETFGVIRTLLDLETSLAMCALLERCPNLTDLSLVYCDVPACALDNLTEALVQKSSLQKLFIGYGSAEDLHSLVLAMARVIEHTTSIVEFGISLPSLGVQEIKRLCVAATKHGQLEALRLVKCGLNDECIEILARSMSDPRFDSLKVLDLSSNDSSPTHFSTLLQSICKRTNGLEELNLSHNSLDLSCCTQVSKLIRQNRETLKLINIRHCFSGATMNAHHSRKAAECLGMALVWNQHLTSLQTSFKLIDQMKMVQYTLQRGDIARAAVVLEPKTLKRPGIRAVIKAWHRATTRGEALIEYPTFIYAIRDGSKAKSWINTVGRQSPVLPRIDDS